jgi:Ala-tRNA(Pro) deacylase
MLGIEESQRKFFSHLDKIGITIKTQTHPPVFTVEDAKKYCDHLPGMHLKNLFLKDKKDQLWLIIAENNKPIDLKKLRQKIGSGHLSFGKPEILAKTLGVIPGSVTPFGLINDLTLSVRIIIDSNVICNSLLNFHPLTNTATSSITPKDLIAFIKSCGHKPEIITI